MEIQEALRSRRSVRQFLDKPVPEESIRRILEGARFAPSGHNVQCWRVFVVTGEAKKRLSAALLRAVDEDPLQERHQPCFSYYPASWHEPYLSRKREVGYQLYRLVGVRREDRAARDAQMRKNYEFFGAPVALFVSFDKRLADAAGTFMDIGMFIQSLLVGARGEGLHTCAQACFNWYHEIVGRELAFSGNDLLVCGVSLGYADDDAPVNALRAPKLSVDEFTTYRGT